MLFYVTGDFGLTRGRKRTYERHKLYYTLDITVNISTEMRWAEHAAHARKLGTRTQIMYKKLQVRGQAETEG